MAAPTIQDILNWLSSLARGHYPEDCLYEGKPENAATGVLFCWMANAGARQAALDSGVNVLVSHEAPYYVTRNVDPGCPPPEEWQVNQNIKQYYASHGVAIIRSHRTLDAYCIPRLFAEHLGFPAPAVREGYEGYDFTLVYDLPRQSFSALTAQLGKKMQLATVRASACDPAKPVSRVGIGWGGVSLSTNLQYMEKLRRHGVEVVLGGEVDEYALEYYRESGMEWIELGHYASEIIGLAATATDLARRFPQLKVECYRDAARRMAHYAL